MTQRAKSQDARDAALADAFVAACRAEIVALKPGNVHVHAPGHGMQASQFEAAANAAAPWVVDRRLKVGARVRAAVEASFAAAGCNTNLGILLLCVPLAAAAQAADATSAQALRESLSRVLAALDDDDAREVYDAIRRANPGGLGRADAADVKSAPTVSLQDAMALAADRDRIARAYVTDFEDIFAFGLPEFHAARRHAASEDDAVTTLHMSSLARFPDSHIARKHGPAAAQQVREEAAAREPLWRPAASAKSRAALIDFDRMLKEKELNPGTTADFVVATLYADRLIAQGVTKAPA